MAPNADRKQISFPSLTYPATRDSEPKLPSLWMIGRRQQDGAEGLWRVHDGLYDLTDYIPKHPGGSYFLNCTKGTDITEAFETHHLKGIAEEILPNYFVRKANQPRNHPFTFEPDGFYRTLKSKVMMKLKDIPKNARNKSDTLADRLLAVFFVLGPLSCWAWSDSTILGVPALILNGFVLAAVITCGHNYCHRGDNWRMYLMNFSGMSCDEWRISHNMSHHLHTNTINDIELSLFEPTLWFLPYRDKPIWAQMGAFYWPIIFPMVLLFSSVKEFTCRLLKIGGLELGWPNFIPFIFPTWIWIAGGIPLSSTLFVWIASLMSASFFFTLYGLTAGHHAHINFFEGDVPRQENMDWGIHQMDTVVERFDYSGDHFKSLTRFGDHALHHLFPTLDHAELKYLYPILLEHCDKYDIPYRATNFYGALLSHSKQLIRKRQNNFKLRSYNTPKRFDKDFLL